MGRGVAPHGNSSQRRGARGSDDATLPTVGFWIPKSGGETSENSFENSSGKTHDKAGRDCRHGGVPDFGKSQPHHRTARIRGRGLYPSGSSTDVTETVDDNFRRHGSERRAIRSN